jgi:hypothetical protein
LKIVARRVAGRKHGGSLPDANAFGSGENCDSCFSNNAWLLTAVALQQ